MQRNLLMLSNYGVLDLFCSAKLLLLEFCMGICCFLTVFVLFLYFPSQCELINVITAV